MNALPAVNSQLNMNTLNGLKEITILLLLQIQPVLLTDFSVIPVRYVLQREMLHWPQMVSMSGRKPLVLSLPVLLQEE